MLKKLLSVLMLFTLCISSAVFADKPIDVPRSFDLLLSYDMINGSKVTISKSLTQQEASTYLKNKVKYIQDNAKTLSQLVGTSEAALKNASIDGVSKSVDYIGTYSVTSATDSMDFGLIETWISVTDASTTTECYKKIKLNFKWHDDPAWYWNDGLGVEQSGSGIGFTNYRNLECYVYDKYGRSYNHSSSMEYVNNGVKAKVLLRDGCYGYMSFKVGNAKTAIPKGASFVAYGRYGHTYIGLGGVSVNFSLSGVNISGTGGSMVKQTTQVSKNNIVSY